MKKDKNINEEKMKHSRLSQELDPQHHNSGKNNV